MGKLFFVLKRVLFWSYSRGTRQYDVMVVLILAFIFLIPASVFDDPEARSRRAGLGVVRERFVEADPAGNKGPEARITEAIGDEQLERVDAVIGDDGHILGYRVRSRTRTAGGSK